MTRARLIARDFVVYGVGEVALKAFALLALPIYTRILGPTEYGEYAVVLTVVALVAATLVLGGDSAYARFFFSVKSLEERQRLTTTWITFLVGAAVVGVGILVPFAGLISVWLFGTADLGIVLGLGLLSVPIGIANRMCAQVLRNQFRSGLYTALNISGSLVSVALPVLAAASLHLGITGIFGGLLIAEAIQLPVRLYAVRAMLRRPFAPELLRALLTYGVPLVPTSLAYWTFLLSDRAVLAKLSSLEQVGIYSVAVTVVAAAGTAIAAVGQAWSPHVVEVFETDEAEAGGLVASMATQLLAGFGLLAVALTAFAPELITLFSTAEFRPAAGLVAPLALAMVAQASTTVTALGISLRRRTKYLAFVAWTAAVVNVGLNVLLDGALGATGAAWATTISYVVLSVGFLVISQRLWPVAFERRKVVVALTATILFTVLATLIPTSAPASILLGIVACAAFVGVLIGLRVVAVHHPRAWLRALRQP